MMRKLFYAKCLCIFLCSLILLTMAASCGQKDAENDKKEDVPTGKVYDIDTDALGKSYPLTDIVDISALEAAGITELTFSKDGKNQIHKIDAEGIKELTDLLVTLTITPIIPDNYGNIEKQLSCGTIINAVKTINGDHYFTFREDVLKGDKFDHPSIRFFADNAEIAENIIAKYENKTQVE